MNKMYIYLICLSVGGLLVSCDSDDALTNDWRDGNVPIVLTATVDGHTLSRASTDNTWDGGEEVGVRLDGTCYKFIVDAQGKMTAAPGQGVRWNSPDEVKTVSAWYPYSADVPQTFTVDKRQQSSYPGYADSDFLWASETRISPTGNKKITFRHLPVKVVVNVKAGNGVKEDELSKVRVSFHNQSFTSGKINPIDGTVEQLPAEIRKDSIYAYEIERPEAGFVKSMQILLVPQLLIKSKPLLKVYTVQQGWFYYTPENDNELSFQAGKKYIYNITVEKKGLSVVRLEDIDTWDTGSEEVKGRTPEQGFGAKDLKIFDYYYSDGTWSDGGYRRYTDGTKEVLDIMPEEGKQVIGIVFQTRSDRISKQEKDSGWNHGYAVSTTVCGEYLWVSQNEWEWGVRGNNIPSMENDALTTFIACKRYIYGYEATFKVIDYIGKGDVEALKNTKYEAFYKACQYGKTDNTKQYAAPAKITSGWYLPSVGQWWDILENLFDCELDAPADAVAESGRDGQIKSYSRNNITTQLGRLSGSQDFSSEYWTSSIYDWDYGWCINFDQKVNEAELSRGNKEIGRKVRSVLAF